MPYRPAIAQEIKEQILARIKEGVPVSQVAKDHGVRANTVYGWLSTQASHQPGMSVMHTWQKEKAELLEVIGNLTFKLQKWEKKYAH